MESDAKKPLSIYVQDDKTGLKDEQGNIVVEALFDEIIEGCETYIGIRSCCEDCDDWDMLTEAFSYDLEGRQIACISDKMRSHGYGDFNDVYHIASDIFAFTHTNGDGYEVLGLFGARGTILLTPKYDELHEIDGVALLGYYSPRYHEFKYDWEKDDSFTLLSISGQILWHGSITGHGYDDTDTLYFSTSGGEFLTIENKWKTKLYTPVWSGDVAEEDDEDISLLTADSLAEDRLPDDYGDQNTIVTKSRYEVLKKHLKMKMADPLPGIDPELLALIFEVGAFYIEAGARNYKSFAKTAISDLGEEFMPFLMSAYMGGKYLPGIKQYAGQMDSEESAFVQHKAIQAAAKTKQSP